MKRRTLIFVCLYRLSLWCARVRNRLRMSSDNFFRNGSEKREDMKPVPLVICFKEINKVNPFEVLFKNLNVNL